MTLETTPDMQDTEERDQYLTGDFDEQLWPEPPASSSEEEQLLTLAETPGEWPSYEQRLRQENAEVLSDEAAPAETEAEAAVEEWTAGMVRPPLDVAAREPEEEPIEPVSQPPVKSSDEAEREAKYGI